MIKRGTCLFSFFLLLILVACKDSNFLDGGGDAPTIVSMTPASVSKGDQNVHGSIRGSNFIGIVSVNLGAGISINNTSLINSTQIDVTFSVDGNATGGQRTIQVNTPGGTASSSTVFSVIDNKLPNAAFTMNPAGGGVDTEITFNASQSSDTDGNITKYEWQFGDGKQAKGEVVTHKYSSEGDFDVRLTVTDNQQGASSVEKTVSIEKLDLPVPRFSITPHIGDPDTPFLFDASTSTDRDGRIVEYLWNFGDGASDRGKTTRHKYDDIKTFHVELIVTDNDGQKGNLIRELEVRGKEPVARYTVIPASGDTTTTFHFDASASLDPDGRIVEFEWLFGDGSSTKGKTADHRFTTAGTFDVELVITDNHGLEQNASRGVKVDGDVTSPTECTVPAKNNGFIYGDVIGVESHWAIVQFPSGTTCSNAFYYCGDMRRANPEGFYGIIHRMIALGGGKFKVLNDCPYRWPPAIGEQIFLYWKSCSVNYCP